ALLEARTFTIVPG
ncbi:hypothetical protein CTYAZ2_35460, partial [Comamonas testosteroni]